MGVFLPLGAEDYIVSGDPVMTLKNLADAVGRGEFGLEVVQGYVSEVRKGREPRFSRTRPALLAIKEAIEAEPGTEPRKVVYRGLSEGLWSWEDVEAFEMNAQVLSETRKRPSPRGTYLTRNRRTRPLMPDVDGQFSPKLALGVSCHQGLTDGAKACMAVLAARAGRRRVLVTYTSSIAAQLGRTPRTVRNHFIQLEAAGLITREPGKHPNTVRIVILDAALPEPWQEPEDQKAFRLARRSNDPALRLLAETVVIASLERHREPFGPPGRRKGISAFNLDSDSGYGGGDVGPSAPTSHSRLIVKERRRKFGIAAAASMVVKEAGKVRDAASGRSPDRPLPSGRAGGP